MPVAIPTMFCRRLAYAILALGVVAAAHGSARADHLDEALNNQATKIVDALRKAGCKNVGVLRFRVKYGDRAESYTAGSLNSNLAERLENILVMNAGSDEKEALGVIHEASLEAARQKVGKWFESDAERRKLFEVDTYSLAWGNKKVRADVFLTGVVTISADYKKCNVAIEMLRESEKVEKVAEAPFASDISLLKDLGQSYSLSKRVLGPGPQTALKTRDAVFTAINNRDPDTGGDSGGSAPDVGTEYLEAGGVELRILSDNVKLQLKTKFSTSDKSSVVELVSPDPKKKTTFTITLKSGIDQPRGVIVRVNGVSVLFEGKEDPDSGLAPVFVLKPDGKHAEYTLDGFFYKEKNERSGKETLKTAPFKVLEGDDAKARRAELEKEYGADSEKTKVIGTISLEVYAPGDGKGEILVSARGLTVKETPEARRSLSSLQTSLMRNGSLKRTVVKSREVIVPDKDAISKIEDDVLKIDPDFVRNRTPIGLATINLLPRSARPVDQPAP